MSPRTPKTALRLALLYALFAGLWIFFSEQLLIAAFPDPETRAQWSIYKGWIFVLVTAVMLFSLLQLEFRARERAVQALRESEERLRVALNAGRLGTWDWDLRQDTITSSPQHDALWGFKPGEFDGSFESLRPRMFPADIPGLEEAVRRTREDFSLFRHEFRIVWPDGSIHWLLGQGEIWLDDQNRPHRMLGVVAEITRRKDAEAALRQSEQQLRALSTKLERLREEERTRISREIHDELGQMLTGIKMDLRWMEQRLDALADDRRLNPILDRVVSAAELADATIKTVQRISAELRPGLLDKLGLVTALQYEASQFESRHGIHCELILPASEPVLPPRHATAFFRIFQEALTNVARHAGATKVRVELHCDKTDCTLQILDDGKGILPQDLQNPESLGLLGMRERARLLGGDVSFSPAQNGGTMVLARIPGPTANHV